MHPTMEREKLLRHISNVVRRGWVFSAPRRQAVVGALTDQMRGRPGLRAWGGWVSPLKRLPHGLDGGAATGLSPLKRLPQEPA
jgi:hypothetical protein